MTRTRSRRGRRPARLVAALALAAAGACDGGPAGVPPDDRHFVRLLDYAELGHRRAERYLRDRAPGLEAFRACRRAVCRIVILYGDGKAAYGSGVVVGDGRHVVTAAHVGRVATERDGWIQVYAQPAADWTVARAIELQARVVAASPADVETEDWCVLELLQPPDGLPAVDFASCGPGDVLVGYGYPNGMGIDRADRCVYWPTGDEADLAPFLHVVRVPDDEDALFVTVAGNSVLGGMSGGPLFDSAGRVVRLMVGWDRVITNDGATTCTRTSPVAPAQAVIEGR